MSQQLAIIVLIDVAAALQSRTLENNTYLFDNMKLQGSQGEGTGELVTAINGSYWSDGSQATEQLLNWIPSSLGSIPPTVPRNFHAERARASDREALDSLRDLATRAEDTATDVVSELNRIHATVGPKTRVLTSRRVDHPHAGQRVMDVTGRVMAREPGESMAGLNNRAPIIADISGEAVDKRIMYPAQYGSPNEVSEGWYWSAPVDTSRPGTYAYTMEIHVHELVWSGGAWVWEPVRMTYESRIRIATGPMRNGFTNGGIGMLPIA